MTAVPVEGGPDMGAPWHYGDPVAEQRALSAGTGVVDLSHRPVLRVSGPDRLPWLHSLTTQHLLDLPPNIITQALILSPHGHVEHHLTLCDDGVQVLAHVEPGTLEPLLDYLRSMVFWSEVHLEDASGDLAVVQTSTGLEGDRFVRRVELPGVLAARTPVGLWAAEALRVSSGRPRLGFETDHRTIPAEVGWIGPAVHLDKGCYRGQETVARVHNLGRPPRRLVLLHLDGSQSRLPEHGDPVTETGPDGRAVGFVGTAARHHELGPLALALVRRTVVDGQVLLAGSPERLVSASVHPAESMAPTALG